MDEPINKAARGHEEAVEDWQYAQPSRTLYRFFDLINAAFFESKLPTPVLSFRRKRGALGYYVIGRNESALQENVNINPSHLCGPLAEVVATLAHELLHSWQQNFSMPGRPPYHNKEFRSRAEAMGIPSDQWGHSLGMKDPFVSFLRAHGVDADMRLECPPAPDGRVLGRTSLIKWSCGCTRIWSAMEVQAHCTKCGHQFERVCA
jgi:hypothetical protein